MKFNFIKNYMCKNKFSGQIYYIENGRIVIMMQGSMRFKSKEIADYLLENLPTEYKCDDITIDSEFAVCHVCYDAKNNENVLKNFADLMALAECFHEINKDTTKLIEFADERTRSNFEQLANIDRILLDAINNNKFEMYYQPIYSTIENRIVSAEALIRLKHDGKFISPEFFIPASERNGMIHRIGDFVLESVCQFVASDEFKKTGLDYVELNLSVSQCMRSDIADKIQGFVDKYKIDPKQINLEITESAIDRSANTMLQNVSKLSQMGFTFSLDDFGTGYSNIKRVVTLPLKIIKFDKTFVNEASNPQMQIVLKNNIDMMKEMNKEIVVEGIETQDMLKLFSDYKCDFIQGYYFSKPLPVPEFCEWIENWKKTA